MWIDISEDGSCHLGVDAFLAKVVGEVERVSFLPSAGTGRPTAVLRACGLDLTMVFPGQVSHIRPNVHLRSHPDRLVSDPYGRGWLFEGRATSTTALGDSASPALYRGQQRLVWMKAEADRLTRFVHDTCRVAGPDGGRLLNDGGSFSVPLAPHLAAEDRMLLYNSFFSVGSSWRPS